MAPGMSPQSSAFRPSFQRTQGLCCLYTSYHRICLGLRLPSKRTLRPPHHIHCAVRHSVLCAELTQRHQGPFPRQCYSQLHLAAPLRPLLSRLQILLHLTVLFWWSLPFQTQQLKRQQKSSPQPALTAAGHRVVSCLYKPCRSVYAQRAFAHKCTL